MRIRSTRDPQCSRIAGCPEPFLASVNGEARRTIKFLCACGRALTSRLLLFNLLITLGVTMPHLSVEYSANLDGRANVGALCERLLEAILDVGLFELGAVRVRAIRCEHYAVADKQQDNAFIDLNFRIGAGRTPDERKRAGEAVFAVAQEVLTHLFDTPHFALSLELREIDPELSWKRNGMHTRLRNSKDQGKGHHVQT